MREIPFITVLTARHGRKEENYENRILITKSNIGGENYGKNHAGTVRGIWLRAHHDERI